MAGNLDSPRRSRRWFLGAGVIAIGGSTALAAKVFNVFADAEAEGALSVEMAHEQATNGEIYLVDIRRPDEWSRTGVAAPAILLDMRRSDFEDVLRSLLNASGTRPIALICARGVRSNRTNARLLDAGFLDILDVPEGMSGSWAGAGWISKGLPLRKPSDAELSGQAPV